MYPVSSSAQLVLLPWLLGWEQPEDRTRFAAGLHAGSAVGLALALREDLPSLTPRLVLTSAPAAAAGFLLLGPVERRLGRPGPTAALLAGAGVALWLADRRTARGRSDGLAAAAGAQVLALAPGVSRSGATLTALRAAGVEREEALRTSLLMSLPVALGAAGLTAVRGRRLPPAVPSLVAGVAAYAAARRRPSAQRVVSGSVIYRLAVAAAVATRLPRRTS